MPNTIPHGNSGHQCCFHDYRGAIWMVIPDGHVLQKCCKCEATRLIHVDHAHGRGYEKWCYNGPPPKVTWTDNYHSTTWTRLR